MNPFELRLKRLPIRRPSAGYRDRVLAGRPRPSGSRPAHLFRRRRTWLLLPAAVATLVVVCLSAVFYWLPGEADRKIAQVQFDGVGRDQRPARKTVVPQEDLPQFDVVRQQRESDAPRPSLPAVRRDIHDDLLSAELADESPKSVLPAPKVADRMFRHPAFSEGLAAAVGPLAEGAAPVAKSCSSALGYIDYSGAWVIPPKFRQAEDFAHGIARVQDADGKPYYYIDRTGKRVPEKVVGRLEPELKVFKENGKYGYVDTRTGEIVVKPEYGWARPFSEGLARVVKPGTSSRAGYFIDRTGKMVIAPNGHLANDFHEGLAAAAGKVTTSGSDAGKVQWGFIDRTGKFVIPPQFDETYDFSEGLAVVSNNGKVGFIDRTGKVMIPLKYRSARGFSEGVAVVRLSVEEARAAGLPGSESGWTPWGYIDHSGKFVSPERYSAAQPFSDGLAYVSQYYVTPEGFRGFINHTGARVLDMRGPREMQGVDPNRMPIPKEF